MTSTSQESHPITVVPATTEHWTDIQVLFANTPCWCQYYRVTSSEYGRSSRDQLFEHWLAERKEALHRQLEGETPPGVLAYLGDTIVGWCGIGVRAEMGRLVRSRTIPKVDDRPVWSIVCFLVRPGYRRRGVARVLLRGAIETARSFSAPALEAYPVDPSEQPGNKPIHTSAAYVGTIAMFEQEGFQRVTQTTATSAGLTRWLVRLDLARSESVQQPHH